MTSVLVLALSRKTNICFWMASGNAVPVYMHAVRPLFPLSPSSPLVPRNTRCQVDTQNRRSTDASTKRKCSSSNRLPLLILAFLSSSMAGPPGHLAVNAYRQPSDAKQWSRARAVSSRRDGRHLTNAKRLRGKGMNQSHEDAHLLSQPSSTSIRYRYGRHTRIAL